MSSSPGGTVPATSSDSQSAALQSLRKPNDVLGRPTYIEAGNDANNLHRLEERQLPERESLCNLAFSVAQWSII